MNPNFSPPISGLVWITGFHNSGCTTMATTVPGCTNDMIVLLDFDGKGAAAAKQFVRTGNPYGGYYDMLTLTYRKKPLEIYKIVDDIITKELAHFGGHIPVLAIDNFAPIMEQALRAMGMSILPEISDFNAGQMKVDRFTWGPTYEFYKDWLHVLSAKTDITFVLTHIKPTMVGQQRVQGSYYSLGKDPIDALATFKVWLIPSELYHGAPVGVVFKNLFQQNATEGGNIPIWTFPPRIAPCNWDTIYEYLKNPVGTRKLEPHEELSPAERNLLGGEMSEELKQAYREALDLDKRNSGINVDDISYAIENPQVDPALVTIRIKALHLSEPDLTAPQIMGRLASEGVKVTIPLVIQAIA